MEGVAPLHEYEQKRQTIEMSTFVLCFYIDLFDKVFQMSLYSFQPSLYISLLYFLYFNINLVYF